MLKHPNIQGVAIFLVVRRLLSSQEETVPSCVWRWEDNTISNYSITEQLTIKVMSHIHEL